MLPHYHCSSWILCKVTCWAVCQTFACGFFFFNVCWVILRLFMTPRGSSLDLHFCKPRQQVCTEIVFFSSYLQSLSACWFQAAQECDVPRLHPWSKHFVYKSYGWWVNWVFFTFIFRSRLTNLLCCRHLPDSNLFVFYLQAQNNFFTVAFAHNWIYFFTLEETCF